MQLLLHGRPFCTANSVWLFLQHGLVVDSKKPQAVDEAPASDSWQPRLLQPFHAVAAQLKEILSGGLLETTLLLQFIWFTNALAYYGLVLLTTSVSRLHSHCTCSKIEPSACM